MSSIAFAAGLAAGLAVGYLWAIRRARQAIELGIVTGPRTSAGPTRYSPPAQEIPSIWR